MGETLKSKLTRREFAGALAVAAAATAALAPLGASAQEKKPEEAKPQETPSAEEQRARAAKPIREFKVPEGTEPAFAFRASWGGR